jgi:hypothetical protein
MNAELSKEDSSFVSETSKTRMQTIKKKQQNVNWFHSLSVWMNERNRIESIKVQKWNITRISQNWRQCSIRFESVVASSQREHIFLTSAILVGSSRIAWWSLTIRLAISIRRCVCWLVVSQFNNRSPSSFCSHNDDDYVGLWLFSRRKHSQCEKQKESVCM